MNLKYCYNKEIHKTFTPPATFQGLLDDIRAVFESKLPNKFSVQYKDNDQDLITISSDAEYKSMLKFEAPNNIASIRLYIVPTNKSPDEKEISFEVIDTSQSSLKEEGGISEISLSPSRSQSAASRGSSSSPKRKHGSHSFDGFDTTNNCEVPEQKMHVSYLEPYVNQTFSQLYEAEAMVLQGLQAEPAERNDCSEANRCEEGTGEQNIDVEESMASQSDSLYAAMQGETRSLENMIFTNEIEKVTQELAAKNTPKMLEKLRTSNNYEESLLNQFLYPHDNFHNMSNIPQSNNNNTLSFDLKDHFDEAREVNITSQNHNNMQVYETPMEPNNNNRYSTPFNPKRRLWLDDIEEPNQDYPSETFPQFRYNKVASPPKQREWTRFPTQRKIVNCDNYQKPKTPTYYQPPAASYGRQAQDFDNYRYLPELSRNNQAQQKNTPACEPYYKQDIILMENQGYEVTTGLSSRLFSIGDSEGQRVVYKTVFIKNTGTKPWTRCFVKSVGLIAGKTVELCNIGVGQTAVVTLELTGYFNSRTYTSRWKLVHENQYGMVEVIGGPFDVEFTINSNIITADKVKMNNCEQSFEDDMRVDYGRQDLTNDGYRYEDFASEDEKRSEEDQEVDQTFARYFRPEEEQDEQEGEDYEAGDSIHWFSQQDLYPVRNFANNDSIDEYYLN